MKVYGLQYNANINAKLKQEKLNLFLENILFKLRFWNCKKDLKTLFKQGFIVFRDELNIAKILWFTFVVFIKKIINAGETMKTFFRIEHFLS